MVRLNADFWVRAYLRRLELEMIPAFVVARGDATAGAVLVKCSTLDGRATAYQRGFDLARGERIWMELVSGAEAEVDRAVDAQRRTDPDLWVIEVEDRSGRHLLDAPGLV